MGYQLGIDLGTTYSAAAVCRSSEDRWVEPEVVTLGTRAATVPSVLFVGADGAVLVGEAAERRALTEPDRVVREFKRRIGDPTPVVVAGRPWAAEELAARLVSWIVDRVAEREGGPAQHIALTHPASWGQHKKELLADALAVHGLRVSFLAEPQAAALQYASAERVETGSTIAVYDLGGGTFDAAVVRKGVASDPDTSGTAGFGLLGRPEGIAQLGGIDFDQAVFDHVMAGMPDAFADLDDSDPAVLAAVARLRRECTEAKEVLSSDTEVSVPVLLPGVQGSVRLHRSEFELMIGPRVEETVAALRRAVASAGLVAEQLTAVLLVGGSSRIPLVSQLVSEQIGRPVAVDADPKHVIAKGAALAVSPKPTVSWPGVVIPPVESTAELMALAGAPAGGSAEPSPAGFGEPGAGLASFEGPVAPAPVSRDGAQPAPPRPPMRPVSDWEYDEQQPPPRRRGLVGVLVGVGGVLAAAAVVGAVLTWPTSAPASAGSTVSGPLATSEAPADPGARVVEPVANPVQQPGTPNVPAGAPAANVPVAGRPAPGLLVAPGAPVVPPASTVPPDTVPPTTPTLPGGDGSTPTLPGGDGSTPTPPGGDGSTPTPPVDGSTPTPPVDGTTPTPPGGTENETGGQNPPTNGGGQTNAPASVTPVATP